ncbi:HD domain-containing phosphohydrolase [Sulfuriflexus mobilis]|uniref:HD domain-containing phosphohydrolase n=1 Tax=Sulfuriflexus mobilis TaxID=1811807 RepID=UPI000F8255E7|nr:HD domain-containing phosphohydrolase [Sulfuriflexus mobilis]
MSDDSHYQHSDSFAFLHDEGSLKEKIVSAHRKAREKFPFLARIAVTLYDSETSLLKTYLHSSGEDNPIENYQTPIDNAPSLKHILEEKCPRVINNKLTFEDDSNQHTQRIGRQGYAASYTLPMFNNGVFFGFLFFNSYEKDVFTEATLNELDLYAHIISLMIINETSTINTLTAALKTTGHITHLRDPETGSHLDRMSRYSRLIATALAEKYQLDDDYIEHVFMFSPLHDIGKIAIPDEILLKKSHLTHDEMEIMKTHTTDGLKMIDDLLANFGLDNISHTNILRNIALSHHEKMNGTGYPEQKIGEDIPLEARIVAVADIFDALTSKRSYKEAWDNQEAFTLLQKLTNEELDAACVNALIENENEILEIQRRFQENVFG